MFWETGEDWAAWAAVIVAFTPDDPVTFRIYDKECLVELVRYWVTRRYASFGDVKTLVVEKEARLNEPPIWLGNAEPLARYAVKTFKSGIRHLALIADGFGRVRDSGVRIGRHVRKINDRQGIAPGLFFG